MYIIFHIYIVTAFCDMCLFCLQLSNEDSSRIASLLDEGYVKAILAVQMLLPGTSSSYYGDEISMKNGDPQLSDQDPLKKLGADKVSHKNN